QDVLACLVEELERQRNVPAVDVMHLRDERSVRYAIGRACRERRGDLPVEAVADRIDAERGHAMRLPAAGPGVCWNASAGVNSIATSSPGEAKNARTNGSRKPSGSMHAANAGIYASIAARSRASSGSVRASLALNCSARCVSGTTNVAETMPFSRTS